MLPRLWSPKRPRAPNVTCIRARLHSKTNAMTSKLERRKAAEIRGRRSETLAALSLACKFYRVIGRRVKTRAGELDLVALSPSGVLCFIEVKARGLEDDAVAAVTMRQRVRIARAAALYLAARPG